MKLKGYAKPPSGLRGGLKFEFDAAVKESYNNAIVDILEQYSDDINDDLYLKIIDLHCDFNSAPLFLLKSLANKSINIISKRLFNIKSK